MIPFEQTEAHPQEALSLHLAETAQLIQNSCNTGFRYGKYALLAGFFHDAGKATSFFQTYLKTGKKQGGLSDHALLSAHLYAYAVNRFCTDPEKDYGGLLGFLSIAKHHGNFGQDIPALISRYRDALERSGTILIQQLEAMDMEGLAQFINSKIQADKLPLTSIAFESPEALHEQILKDFWKISFGKKNLKGIIDNHLDFFSDRYYSCGLLWQADKIHTATRQTRTTAGEIPQNLVHKFLMDLNCDHPFDEIRAEIHQQVMDNIGRLNQHRLFTLTAPTGSGKTLTLLDAALMHKFQNQGKRIIYCLPFTSVIEQNHSVFFQVLKKRFGTQGIGEDMLLKHHHLTAPVYEAKNRQENELSPDGQALFVETWQSELVVTTFHQLLFTIFTDRNRNIKRFPQLSEAVIILDEVQAIPVKYWKIVGKLLAAIARHFDTSIILATATKPLIFPPEMGAEELLPGHENYYQRLSRIQLINRACPKGEKSATPFSGFLETVADTVAGDKNMLLVLNTKNAVRRAYEVLVESRMMPGENILMLSKSLTSEDRLAKINRITDHMEAGEKILLISTQLIEAGVDLSFDIVHRDFAPLDCVVQTAGRCNRHWKKGGNGTVYLWHLYDDEKEKPYYFSRIYDPVLLDITQETLGYFPQEIQESTFYELFKRYFQLAMERAAGNQSEEIVESIRAMKFNELEEQFKLIEDEIPTTTYFVIKDDADAQLWDQYLDLKHIQSPIKRKRTFQEFKQTFMQKTVDVYCRDESLANLILPAYMEKNQYSEEYGLNEEFLAKGEGTLCL